MVPVSRITGDVPPSVIYTNFKCMHRENFTCRLHLVFVVTVVSAAATAAAVQCELQ
jgi:hypothetical protein